jgi:hypothetical protein
VPVVSLPIQDLVLRGTRVQQILRPLAGRPPAWRPVTTTAKYIIGVHEGAPTQTDYRAWRFSTVVRNLRAQYFELWLRSDEEHRTSWYLDRAYLNIFKVDRDTGQETKFLCLHCDPNFVDAPAITNENLSSSDEGDDSDEDSPSRGDYKRSPHLHIKIAGVPFSRAHIALNSDYLSQVLSSVESLTTSMEHAIQMLRDEVFDYINAKLGGQH